MVLQLKQNLTFFVHFLNFLLSNHPKTNIYPYSMIQDSTLDTPQGGVGASTGAHARTREKRGCACANTGKARVRMRKCRISLD